MKSDISGFYRLSVNKRVEIVQKFAHLSSEETRLLLKTGALDINIANRMIENVIGITQIPLGIATNYKINGRDLLVPMAIEEPSVVAASSHAAKLTRPEGFTSSSDEPIMIGQIQLVGVKNIEESIKKINKSKNIILEMANKKDSTMIRLGGGAKDVEAKKLVTRRGPMLIVHLIVDVRDAMGANCVNTMCESISSYLEEITGGSSRLKIISNLAVKRLARASAVWKKDAIGKDVVEGILDAYAFAESDPFRCATHNKGAMNGVDAVMLATGNDFRAIEAGAHSYASYNKKGCYSPLTKFWKTKSGDLAGSIEMPMAVGLVGGATKTHPIAQIAIKILGVKNAKELAEIAVCVGLANNFAALRAMVVEGIQKGHMKLHADNIAVMAGATGSEIDIVVREMTSLSEINLNKAAEILNKIRKSK